MNKSIDYLIVIGTDCKSAPAGEILHKIEAIQINIKYSLGLFTLVFIFAIPNLGIDWLNYIAPIIYGILFSMIIMFTLCERNFIYIKDKYWISKLGIFTYGLYMYHTIVINLLLHTQHIFPFEVNWFVFSILSLILTILISIMSYHLFEKHFLKLKKYFYNKNIPSPTPLQP